MPEQRFHLPVPFWLKSFGSSPWLTPLNSEEVGEFCWKISLLGFAATCRVEPLDHCIARIKGAWVIRYSQFILFDGRVTYKVQGRLLPSRIIYRGVDMGRSFSAFLFCFALDPLFHYLNRIPHVVSVQAYVDDTTPLLEMRKMLVGSIKFLVVTQRYAQQAL